MSRMGGVMVLALALAVNGAAAQTADQVFKQASGYYDEFTWDKAIELFEQFVAKHPGDGRVPEAEYKVLYARYRLDRLDEFERQAEAFCDKYRKTIWGARGRSLLARFLFEHRRWQNWEKIGALYAEALRDYRSSIGRRQLTDPEKRVMIDMLFEAAEFYANWYTDRSKELAAEHLQTIIQYNLDAETTARAWLRLGALQAARYDDQGKAEEAWLTVVKEFAETASADEALWSLALTDERRGDYVRARARYLELRRRYPKSEYEDDVKQRIAEIEQPRLDLGISTTHLPGAEIPTRLRTRNLRGVKLTAAKVDVRKLLAAPEALWRDVNAMAKLATETHTWRQAVPDEGKYEYHSIKLDSPMREAGLYLVKAVAEDNEKIADQALVNLSSLVLVQHYAARKLVSYTASRMDRQPVQGVELHVYREVRNAAREVGKGVTDADGLDTMNVGRQGDEGWQLSTVGLRGDEVVFQTRGLYAWWREPEEQLTGYIYTDRPVYRPENTVHYRAILRTELDGDYTNLPGRKVELLIRDARGQELKKETLTTDEYGSVGGELTLGAEPTLGVYNVQITFGKQTSGGSFRVEEYRKPEFKVEVGRPLADVRPGGAAAVPVTATYYFGAPVAGAEVKFHVQRRVYHKWYWFPGPWDWFYAGWRERPHWYGGDVTVTEGTVKTDEQGRAVLEFPAADDANDYTYTIHAEVADVTRRVVDATGSLTVTRKGFFLFANANQGLYAPDDDVSITVRAENADGQAVQTPFTAALWRMKWIEEKKDEKTGKVTVAGHYERDAKVWQEDRRAVTDPDSGERKLIFKAPADGYYELEATAPDTFDPKSEIKVSAHFWVSSKAWKGVNYNHANLQLITEKDLYERGDTARLLVNSPVPTGAVLLTIGANEIFETKVIRIEGNSTVLELPIRDNYSPNVYLNAVVVSARQVYFAQKELMVPPTDEFLKVAVASDRQEYKPRTKGTFTLKTTDSRGRPVSAQVSLGITDDSVYAIQEEMVSPIGVHFYGHKRWWGVRQAVSFEGWGEYDESFGDRVEEKARRGAMADGVATTAAPPPAPMAGAAMRKAAPAEAEAAPGGAGGGEEPVAIREFFPDTILWQPAVVTGADGTATVTVEFPDSLTTWRATARAITKDTQVGQQVERVISTKDLIVRLQAPRFFTQLDRSTISVVVTNKTSKQLEAAVALQVEGLKLVGDVAGKVVLEPNGQARLDREVVAVEPGQATIVVTARGPDDSDGLKKTFEIIPHGAEKFAAAAGRMSDRNTATMELNLPAERREDATRLKVTVAPTLVSCLLDALPYLVEYPYGCVEQTTSKFLPAVLVARTLDYTGKPVAGGKPRQVPEWWKSRGLDELPDMVNTGIKRLASMQNPDGGFGWFGGMRSDVWMSAYVTYGLMQARMADFSVPGEVLGRAVGFLLGNLHLLKSQHDSSAYVAWVLSDAVAHQVATPDAEQKKALEDAFQRVYANRDELNDYTRALLVLGLVNKGEKDKAAVVWRNLQGRRIETERGNHWGRNQWGWRWSEDQVETTSFCLLACLAIEPASPLAAKTVDWLVLNRTGNRWYSTKDTAAAIFALTRFADQSGELKAKYSVALSVNGKEVKGWEVTPDNALSLDGAVEVDPKLLKSGANKLELRRDGGGTVYYSAFLEYYTREDPITAAANYISATRRYVKVTDYTDPQDNVRKQKREELKGGETIASGERLEVEVTVNAENDFDYVCFADPKPAGCEPVDQTSGGTWGGAWMYRELRDEEVTFFVDHLRQGKTTFSYELRAETPGVFRALPHNGFSMYRADVRCLSDEAILRIGERPAAAE